MSINLAVKPITTPKSRPEYAKPKYQTKKPKVMIQKNLYIQIRRKCQNTSLFLKILKENNFIQKIWHI